MTRALEHMWLGLRRGDRSTRLHVSLGVAVVLGLALALLLTLPNPSGAAVNERAMRIAKAAAGGFSDDALRHANAEMDPAMLALARRYDPSFAARADSLSAAPPGPLGAVVPAPFSMTPEKAAAMNADLPFSRDPNPPARPFSLAGASVLDRSRATDCLTQAIYYEAAFEPLEGQRAVAQVVINRMRHPAFPKTICGVVFQGATLPTGCQFSFTCDGALARPPAAWAWARARSVAQAALDGYVMASVGGATHYHADYVSPYWAPRLYKVHQVGAHIFYRWPGSWGLPAAFSGRYAGMEQPGVDLGRTIGVDLATLKLAGLEGAADAAQQASKETQSFAMASAVALGPDPAAAPIAAPVIAETAPVEMAKPPPLAVVEINRQPRQPPRLAMD